LKQKPKSISENKSNNKEGNLTFDCIKTDRITTSFNINKEKNKDLEEKHNRVFRLLRMTGLVNIFRKIGRNLGIRIHTIPSYYTSKWCNKCNHIEDNNRYGKLFLCVNCNDSGNADKHAGENIEIIFARFANLFSVINSFGEFDAKKFIKKEFVKENLMSSNFNEVKKQNFSLKIS
jgi:hypothetical protein